MTIDDRRADYAGHSPTPYEGHDVPGATAWRIAVEYDDNGFDALLADFFEKVDTTAVEAIVIGLWGEAYESTSEPIVAALTANAAKLPKLRALFLGDIVQEEAEISWIQQSDVTPLLTAFPLLEQLDVRGAEGLALTAVKHEALRVLRFESGGLPGAVVRGIAGCDLPALDRLELWLGVENYGGDATVPDLAPILTGERLPALRHLGLQNSELEDEIAAAVASAPVVARLESLSLSMGTLSDEGAEALLAGQPLTHLRALDLSHHFLSDAMMDRVRAALPGVEVDLSSQEQGDEAGDGQVWRFVAVSE